MVQRVLEPATLVRLRLRADESGVAGHPQQRDRGAWQLLQPQERLQPQDPGRQFKPDQDLDQAVASGQSGVGLAEQECHQDHREQRLRGQAQPDEGRAGRKRDCPPQVVSPLRRPSLS